MAEKYANQDDNEPMKVNDDSLAYPQGITIPITLPSTGGYSVESLKKELTDFALKLLHKPTQEKAVCRKITVSERIKALSAVSASSSNGDYKDDFVSVIIRVPNCI